MDFYELLFRAKQGNGFAEQELFETFQALIYKNSFVNGILDEDLFQDQCKTFLNCIKTFKI